MMALNSEFLLKKSMRYKYIFIKKTASIFYIMFIYRVMDWMRFFEQELHVNIGEFFNVVYPISKLFNQFMERIKGTLSST